MPHDTRQRLRTLEILFYRRPDGLSTPEIGEEFGVSRQTAYNDIQRLLDMGVPLYDEAGRWYLNADAKRRLHLTLAEAWFLYLPLRRFVRTGSDRFRLMRDLLIQITGLLHADLATHLIEMDNPPHESGAVFETLVKGWQHTKLVRLRYLRPNARRPTEFIFAPLWFEPAVWSDAFYVIGEWHRADHQPAIMTLKLDRVQDAKLLHETFDPPDTAQLVADLEGTWGIWLGDADPVTVRLRFRNYLLDRLRESRWHPTQHMEIDAQDGSILWTAQVAEPQEMLPWIRGWGRDVEVLEPEDIRAQVASEAAATARLYGEDPDEEPRFF